MGQVDNIAAQAGRQTGARFATGVSSQKQKVGSAIGGTLKSAFAIAGGAALVGGIKRFTFDAAQEARKIGVQTEAVLKSTGGAANVTAEEISNLANRISEYSAIDDEAIQEGQNLLLTFKDIRNESGEGNKIFNEATKILTDMSVAMKTDVSSGAIQLGKALNDPLKGISALSRVGVTFTDDQKKVIEKLVETGDVAGAQKIILEELKTEFGGSARAAGKVDPYGKLNVKLENIGETIGTAVLPALDDLAQGIIDTLGGKSQAQDSLNSFFDSFSANDRAADDISEFIGVLGEQLQAGVISRDEYNRKVADQIAQTRDLTEQFPDSITLQEELNFQVAIAEAAVRRYNEALGKNRINFQEADAAASDYLNTVGAAPSVAFADAQAGGVPAADRNRGSGGRNRGGGGGRVTPLSSEVLQINVDVNGSRLTRAVNSTSRRTKILLGEV